MTRRNGIESSTAGSSIGPAAPKATRLKSRGSMPRRMAMSRMPSATLLTPHPPRVLHPLAEAEVGLELLEGVDASSRRSGIAPPRNRSPSRMPISERGVRHRRAPCRPGRSRRVRESAPAESGPTCTSAGRRDRDDAAAARAERHDVGRQGVDEEVVLELERGVHPRLAVDDDADVARGATDVGADQVAVVDVPAEVGAAHGACRRAADDQTVRALHRVVGGEEPAEQSAKLS